MGYIAKKFEQVWGERVVGSGYSHQVSACSGGWDGDRNILIGCRHGDMTQPGGPCMVRVVPCMVMVMSGGQDVPLLERGSQYSNLKEPGGPYMLMIP